MAMMTPNCSRREGDGFGRVSRYSLPATHRGYGYHVPTVGQAAAPQRPSPPRDASAAVSQCSVRHEMQAAARGIPPSNV